MLRRDALQFQIAADSAVGIQQIPKRSAASAKSRLARLAPPRHDAADAKQVVNDCPAPGAPKFRTTTHWTNELGRLDLRSPLGGWTL